MTDLQQLSTSELTRQREELATRYPAGHSKARRLNKQIAAIDAALSLIPPGQPILVGHHSERRHRRDLERADNNLRRPASIRRWPRRHTEAADTIERQLDVSIYDDDPDAIDKLKTRIAGREAKRERIKQYNRNGRKGSKTLEPLTREEQKELAGTAEVAAHQLGPKGQAPAYWLTIWAERYWNSSNRRDSYLGPKRAGEQLLVSFGWRLYEGSAGATTRS